MWAKRRGDRGKECAGFNFISNLLKTTSIDSFKNYKILTISNKDAKIGSN